MTRIAPDALRHRPDLDGLDRTEQPRFDLIELLYDAATTPERWGVFLQELSAALGGSALLLTLRHPSPDDAAAVVAVGIQPEFQQAFCQEAGTTTDWLPWAIELPPGAVVNLRDVLPQRQLVRTPFYGSWMRPQGLLPAPVLVGVILTKRTRPAATLTIFRPWGGSALGSNDIRLVRGLMPHLQRAVLIHQERRELALQRRGVASVLAGLACSMIVVDRTARVMSERHSNEGTVTLADGLTVVDDELRADIGEESARLHALIAEAARGNGRLPGPLFIRRPSGRPPLRVAAISLGDAAESAVTLLITDPEQRGEVVRRALRQRYRLTPTEASVCALLVGGRSITESAETLGMRVSTARTHLRQIFCKTSTNRQAALVHRLLSDLAE